MSTSLKIQTIKKQINIQFTLFWKYSPLVIHSPNMWWTLWIIYKKMSTVSTKKQKLWTRSSVWVLSPAGSGVDLFSSRQQQEIWNRTEEVGIKRTNSVEFFHSAALVFWACRRDWKSQLTLGFCPARSSSYVPNTCLEAFVALKLEVVVTALITLGHSGCTSVDECARPPKQAHGIHINPCARCLMVKFTSLGPLQTHRHGK